jgi:predicted DNA-binding transcriptional regulator YafY
MLTGKFWRRHPLAGEDFPTLAAVAVWPHSAPRMKSPAQELPQSRPPLERMMRIHRSLADGGYPNQTRLAAELEVTTKTIQRDLDFMRDRLQLPIEFDPRRNGYHYTEEVEAFPTLQISEGELFALLVAEKALQQYRGTPFEKRLVGALKKLSRSLPDTISLNLSEWEQTISFRTTAEPTVDLGIIDSLSRSTLQRQQLRLRYRKPNTRQTEERTVDPYHLANINGDWYLFAFDHLRRAVRTFAAARIHEAVPTGKSFERPARFALDKHLRDSFGVHSKDGDYSVVIRFEADVADYIREKRWHPSQELRELPDGGVELRLRLGSLGEIQRWVLGWGGSARVIEPPELARTVAQAARRILEPGP